MLNNPESLPPSLIYAYQTRQNQDWSLADYRTPREYLDPLKQVREREYASQKKGEKNRKHVTKRGFYMDYDLKVAAGIPGANKHGRNEPWSVDKLQARSKNKKIDLKVVKGTYLDQIEIEQKNHKKPGICTYSLQKSIKEKEAAIAQLKKRARLVGDRHFYHDDTTFLAAKNPGSGMHNPHEWGNKIRFNKTDHKFWTQRHKQQQQKSLEREATLPAPGTYNPLNRTITTFDRIELEAKPQSNSKQKSKGFGTDARFEYTRPDKKTVKQKRPDPISYNTSYGWRSKEGSPRGRPWNEAISKGYVTLSVYH